MKNLNIGIFIIILLITSCIPQKRMVYLQDKNTEDTLTKFFREKAPEYKIQPGDNLYIKVHSLDEKTFAFFNNTGSQTQGGYYLNNDISVYLNSYNVNDLGFVDFPFVGEIKVQNLTIDETKNLIQEIINEFLVETTITVKLVNYKITMVGEVTRPGEYSVYQDNINIFEAISLAGDLTDYANRNEISLVRQTKNGAVIKRIDLTDNKILESDYYYLMPNDILYIKPLKGKQFTFANFPYALVFSAISTTLLLINYFK
ncbi:MAG: polysaccharide biosynthesis/export family protein [Bacteroidales bacterium]|nr:polysaccharide biosynthesis/export family protein [Bacteroidales bacterium]